jgi:signal peptidase II
VAERSSVNPLPNPLQEEGSELAGRPPRGPFWVLIGAVTIPIILLDQATKLFVKAHMELYESIAIVRNYLDITYTLNPGAAFSMLANAPLWVRRAFLMTLASSAIAVLIVLLYRSARVSVTSIAYALIAGGAAGNLIDRAYRGQVIDFVRAHYYDLNYPIFNVADSAISIGVTLLIVMTIFGNEENETPRSG